MANLERQKLHPHKFTLWIAIGAIVMMFAGLTSAYVVRRNQANWYQFKLPVVFWYSTAVLLLSSLTIHLALKAFIAREIQRYKLLLTVTVLLGILFVVLQFFGFETLQKNGVQLLFQGSNPSASFLAVITGLHIVHVLGGVVALLVIFFRAYSSKRKSYSSVPIEMMCTYWHFVDILWIYLFIFFNWIGS